MSVELFKSLSIVGTVIFLIWSVYDIYYIKPGKSASKGKMNKVHESIRMALDEFIPAKNRSQNSYIDLFGRGVSPSAFYADFENRILYYCHTSWLRYNQEWVDPFTYEIPFEKIYGCALYSKTKHKSILFLERGGHISIGDIAALDVDFSNLRLNIRTFELPGFHYMPFTDDSPFLTGGDEAVIYAIFDIFSIMERVLESNSSSQE